MSSIKDVEAKEAKHGQKMIEVKVRFWTNDLVEGKDRIRPKHAWTNGVVRIKRNPAHNISPLPPIPFNSLMDLPAAIEKVLIQHGIKLHLSNKQSKTIVF